MATIKEIADLAGVSRGTVDRVLNNRGAVNA
ncbi:MAG: LacI family DNA-binding transcriptional regulator, partial [Lachnospiraceae bacterium]|nr:LacI family DNA-binding transcriptional regulator [Lachnospiraceae bacterium]